MREITQLVPRTAEARNYFSAGVINNMNDLVAAVHDVHEFLLPIPRKAYPPGSAARVRQFRSPGSNPDVFLKVTHLVKHLDPIALPVTHVH